VFALCGLGGMGKTQIGVSFVFKNLAKFRAVLWAHADSRAKLAESFSLFAVKLGLQKEGGPPQKLQADAKQLVKDWLRTTSNIPSVLTNC
jgi:CO dehydrogenase nickel-insertion accessory protein CooC1